MGTGLHGKNGLNPETCMHLLHTYVVPTMVYGLETISPTDRDMEPLEVQYRKILKQVFSMPDRVADAASYILTGVTPLKALVHKNTLNMLWALVTEGSTEKAIAERLLLSRGDNPQLILVIHVASCHL